MVLEPAVNKSAAVPMFHLKELLKEMLDPDFFLVLELMHRDVLTDSQRQIIKCGESIQDRNERLLNFVLEKDSEAQLHFLAALRESDQEHVCYFIECNGGKQFAV